jgi:hypothetical protein
MAMSRRRQPPTPDRRLPMRRGVVLALLALLSQALVAFLPMPAEAQGIGQAGSMAICGMKLQDGTGAAGHEKSSHAPPDCPVCQSAHLAASLVPPAPIGVVGLGPAPGWRALPERAGGHPRLHAQPQQARAPPSV